MITMYQQKQAVPSASRPGGAAYAFSRRMGGRKRTKRAKRGQKRSRTLGKRASRTSRAKHPPKVRIGPKGRKKASGDKGGENARCACQALREGPMGTTGGHRTEGAPDEKGHRTRGAPDKRGAGRRIEWTPNRNQWSKFRAPGHGIMDAEHSVEYSSVPIRCRVYVHDGQHDAVTVRHNRNRDAVTVPG